MKNNQTEQPVAQPTSPVSRDADGWFVLGAQCTEPQARTMSEYVAYAAMDPMDARREAEKLIRDSANAGLILNERGNAVKWQDDNFPRHATLRFLATAGAGFRNSMNTRNVRAAAMFLGDIFKKEDAAEQNTPEGIARRNNVATAFGLPTRRVSVNGNKSTAVQMNPVVSVQGTRIVIETANMATHDIQTLKDYAEMGAWFYMRTVAAAEINRIAAAKTAAKEAAKATFNSLTDDEKAAFIKELMG